MSKVGSPRGKVGRPRCKVGSLRRQSREAEGQSREAGQPVLTDAEREAIEWAAYAAEKWYEHTAAATLRGLLERTQTVKR